MRLPAVVMMGLFGVLVLLDFGWHIWVWHANAGYRAASKLVRVVVLHTNDVDVNGIGIVEADTGRPVCVEWKNMHDKRTDEISYFLHGTNLLNVYLKTNQPPRYRFIFHGPGKSEVWWMNIDGGLSFTERVSYDTNGDRSGFEVWYNGAWQTVNRKNGTNGIFIAGKWHQLAFDTNGMWTAKGGIDAPE